MDQHPKKIGKYEVLGVAGEGSMGIVYIAHDPFADQKVAIKVCHVRDDDSQASRLARKMFFNEAHTAGSLDHPNILSVLDAGEENQPYIVMEYLEGADTLQGRIHPDHLLSLPRAVEVVYRCAKALDYAHRRGVIHRDVKPSNIMLSKDGKVKIGDFGIAQHTMGDFTQVMGMMGSPRYMSPEQAREEEVNHQTDIFSLGIVLYELLTGRPPFVARGFSGLINKIINDDPSPVRQHRGEVPEELERILARMLAKTLEDRYPSCHDLGAELASVYKTLSGPQDGVDEGHKFSIVRRLKFFNEFSDPEVREVIAACSWLRVQDGEEIISEGVLEHSFYIIVSGDVAVTKGGTRISSLGRGDCFGEMGYLTRIERTASIIALDEVELLKINSTLMEQASMTCQLRFTQMFLRTLIERLARTSDALSQKAG